AVGVGGVRNIVAPTCVLKRRFGTRRQKELRPLFQGGASTIRVACSSTTGCGLLRLVLRSSTRNRTSPGRSASASTWYSAFCCAASDSSRPKVTTWPSMRGTVGPLVPARAGCSSGGSVALISICVADGGHVERLLLARGQVADVPHHLAVGGLAAAGPLRGLQGRRQHVAHLYVAQGHVAVVADADLPLGGPAGISLRRPEQLDAQV